MSEKSLEYYMSLPYRFEVYPDEEGAGYAAIVPDLPGCMTASDSYEDLLRMLQDAKRLWFKVALEDGLPIPEPKPLEEEEFSGKFVLRLAKTQHRRLAHLAEEEGVSLNSLVVSLINQAMGIWFAGHGQSEISSKPRQTPIEVGPIPWSEYVTRHAKQPVEDSIEAGWKLGDSPLKQIKEGKGKYAR